ncbi:tetratricopeptide repeat protein [Planctomycetota bacterium]
MDKDSAFGAEPEQLRDLLSYGLEEAENQTPTSATAVGTIMEQPGGQIGPYQLLRLLGEGGMGIVYLAKQEQPLQRQVALKVVKPGMDTKHVIARFDAEKQTLASLDHPNIAQVYDAGTTPSGRPYFVMEFVPGLPVTEYCDRHKLSIPDRLALFLQICHAIQHAHQKTIIHRDIKPSNIIVSTRDNQPVPKIIDFGIAKVMSQSLTEATLNTQDSQLLGTPEYMSPEQAGAVNEDIDTRSDIYSLGVLLYVLLTGVHPFDSESLRDGGIDQIRKVIRETDPKTPSTRFSHLGDDARDLAEKRRTGVINLTRCLHKELEWIPLKAMRKDRTERYRSTSELADDIENYLGGIPLIAGPPSTMYRLKKYARKYRVWVVSSSIVVFVLMAGILVSTLFWIRAEQQARTAWAISDFFSNEVLAAVDPLTGEKPVAFLTPILDIATQRLEGKFKNEPLIEASIRYTLGRRHWHIGEFKAAETNLERTVELGKENLPANDRQLLVYTQELAWVYAYQSRKEKAEALLIEVIERMEKALDEDDSALHQAKNRLAWLYFHEYGRYEQAEALWTEVITVIQRKLGPNHPSIAAHLEGLVVAHNAQGRFKEAETICRRALNIAKNAYGSEDNTTLNHMLKLANICRALGHDEEAEDLYLKTLAIRRRLQGEEHFRTLDILADLGAFYCARGRYDEAEPLLVPVLEKRRHLFGAEGYATLHSMLEVAKLYQNQGHYDKAEPLLLEAEAISRRVYGDHHRITKVSVTNLIKLYEACGRPEEAVKWRDRLLQEQKTTE